MEARVGKRVEKGCDLCRGHEDVHEVAIESPGKSYWFDLCPRCLEECKRQMALAPDGFWEWIRTVELPQNPPCVKETPVQPVKGAAPTQRTTPSAKRVVARPARQGTLFPRPSHKRR